MNELRELIMTKGIKIKVKNESHARQIQDVLFNHGFKWRSGNSTYMKYDIVYLFCERDGISHCGWIETFMNDPGVEVELQNTNNLVPVIHETIEINGAIYKLDDVIYTIKNLKPM